MKNKYILIDLAFAVPGLVLSEDAYSLDKRVTFPAGTILTDSIIFRLKVYQIRSITVIYNNELLKSEVDADLVYSPAALKSKELNNFNTIYQKNILLLNEYFQDIDNQIPVSQEILLSLVYEIVHSVKSNHKLITYLYSHRINEPFIAAHCMNVAILSLLIGKWSSLSNDIVDELSLTGLLHDIGKTRLPLDLLTKSSDLSYEEYIEIKEHTNIGHDMINDYPFSNFVKLGVLMHHEKCNGTGYPYGLKCEELPYTAKIIAICDIYDAMTTSSVYKKEQNNPLKSLQLFEKECSSLLDKQFLSVFIEHIANEFLNRKVTLSDGQSGVIIKIDPASPTLPVVRIQDTLVPLKGYPHLEIIAID